MGVFMPYNLLGPFYRRGQYAYAHMERHASVRSRKAATVHSNTTDEKLPSISGLRNACPKHSLGYRMGRRVRSIIAMVVIACFMFVGSAAAAVWVDLNSTVQSGVIQTIDQDNGKDDEESEIIDPNEGKSIELLILGQDTRDGEGNSALGGAQDSGLHNADTTMVMQIAADRSWINLMSIPRDSLVDVPQCETANGTMPAQYGVMFNSIFPNAWSFGGDLASAASCTMNAVNSLTGLNINNFIVVDFQGLRNMIDALGGVDICIPTDINDSYTGLNLTRGLQHLDGTQATQYARVRHGFGDGTDTMRTTRQQYLIKQLVRTALSKNLLTNSPQLYQLAKSALQALNFSEGLGDMTTLVGLAMSLASFNISNLYAQTVPVTPAPLDPNRRIWADDADLLWAKLRESKPLTENTQDTAEGTDTNDGQTNDGQASNDSSTNDGAMTDDESSAGDSSTSAPTTTATPDPVTGLITMADGTLVDPNTGGIVNPEDGSIIDPDTSEYIGIADRYLNATVCAITE